LPSNFDERRNTHEINRLQEASVDQRILKMFVNLLVAVSDTAFGEVVGRQFQRDAVASEYTDAILSKLAGQVGEHHAFLVQLNAKFSIRQFFDHNAGYFD
jgi:hypothetical protein